MLKNNAETSTTNPSLKGTNMLLVNMLLAFWQICMTKSNNMFATRQKCMTKTNNMFATSRNYSKN